VVENKGASSWKGGILSTIFLSLLPTLGVFILLSIVPWVPIEWYGLTLFVSFLVFFVGGGIFVYRRNGQVLRQSLIIGFMIGVGCIILATLRLLALTPVPVFGNALYVVIAGGFGLGLMFLFYKSTAEKTTKTGPIMASTKSLVEKSLTAPRFFLHSKSETVLAFELVEEPHDYLFSNTEENSVSDQLRRFSSVVRTLFSTPYSICYQQQNGKTRIFFTTWEKDDSQLNHQRTVLQDALQYSLSGFKFRDLEAYPRIELREQEKGSAAIITGVPLSANDELQSNDPLESTLGVLRELENGIIQIFVEPMRLSRSKLKHLEDEYKAEVMRSETVISRERSGILQGSTQESHTSVNVEARKKAEQLERQIRRLSESNLFKTTVTAVSWGTDITRADMDARRMAITLVGSLRPDTDIDQFSIHSTTKRSDIERLLSGLPAGKSTVLTAGEVTNYCRLPRRDLGLRVTKREKFVSGSQKEVEPAEPEQAPQPLVTSLVPTNVQWLEREPVLYMGHPLDETGKILAKTYVTVKIDYLKMHAIVVGNTQSGKSTTLRNIFGQAHSLGVNTILFSPSKSYETRKLLHLSDDIRYFTCGRSDIANLLFNPWNPPKNVRLSKWVDRVVQAWTLWLPNDPVMSMHFEKVVYTMYKRCGWDIKMNKKGRPILISDLIEAMKEEEKRLSYGDEVSSNVFGALVERVRAILRKHALVEIFNTKTGITVAELLSQSAIIDMDPLSSNDKPLLMGILTAAVCEYKQANPTENVTNLLILDEAHYILGDRDMTGEAHTGARMQAVSAFVEMIRIVGGTGLGVIIADQSPTSLVPEVMKIVVNMVIHALAHKPDRELVGSHTRCTDAQIDHIGGMGVGEAVVYFQHEAAPRNVKILPLERFITGGSLKAPVDDAAIKRHMERIIKQYPELGQSEPASEDIVDAPQVTVEEAATSVRIKLASDVKVRIVESVTGASFKEFWMEHLAKGDVTSLTSIIRKLTSKSGDGTSQSYLYILQFVVNEYCTEENIHVFKAIADVLDGEFFR
jgi:hypothetical protein